ncbi:MAG: hypothetical protein HW383_721 [Candidatus Magasanikbacteria bacterium]|nr:hypothetical protein [Candidatus Magasanikbacteria bacterium]
MAQSNFRAVLRRDVLRPQDYRYVLPSSTSARLPPRESADLPATVPLDRRRLLTVLPLPLDRIVDLVLGLRAKSTIPRVVLRNDAVRSAGPLGVRRLLQHLLKGWPLRHHFLQVGVS